VTEEEIIKLSALLDERTLRLMERESELADRLEEIESQKEELTAAIEELVAKNKELAQRNHELDQVLYRTSHDLKAPVTSLSGILSLIERENVPTEIGTYLKHIKSLNAQMSRVIGTLNRMLRAVLDPVQLDEVNLEMTTKRAIQDLREQPGFDSIQIQTIFHGAVSIKSDVDLITILIRELVSNAIMFRNTNRGIVKVTWEAGDDLVLKVEDDGEGVKPFLDEKIFDMFYRGSSNSIGSGMGLYIVNQLVNRLGGKIEWSSFPGLTIFTVTLPTN
jgi:signal transduction histidine kinase